MSKTGSYFKTSLCFSNPSELTFYLVSSLWSYMELPQSAPVENTLLSFIKTFLCPELSSWLHQLPAETPPVSLAAEPGLKCWLHISRANVVCSWNKCQQVWWLQGARPEMGTGRKRGSCRINDTCSLHMLPVKTRSCLAPVVYWKDPARLEQAGCHSDRWVSAWPGS